MIQLHYSNNEPFDIDEMEIAVVESSGDGETTRIIMTDNTEYYVLETPMVVGNKIVMEKFKGDM